MRFLFFSDHHRFRAGVICLLTAVELERRANPSFVARHTRVGGLKKGGGRAGISSLKFIARKKAVSLPHEHISCIERPCRRPSRHRTVASARMREQRRRDVTNPCITTQREAGKRGSMSQSKSPGQFPSVTA